MPEASRDGLTIHYAVDGEGETLVFVNEVAYGAWLWSWQHRAFTGPYEMLVWDLPGTGESDVPPAGHSVADFAADLEAVLAEHGVRDAHLVGVGLGGAIALTYAREYSRAETLTLVGTPTHGGAVDGAVLEGLYARPDDREGLRQSIEHVLSPTAIEANPDLVEQITEWRTGDDADQTGYERQADALREFDARDWLYEVTTPTLCCRGEEDALVPAESVNELADGLPRAEQAEFVGGHLCCIEAAQAFNDRLDAFLADHRDD
jgi:pimeloyl-ACP methyl ester carboxylesterase